MSVMAEPSRPALAATDVVATDQLGYPFWLHRASSGEVDAVLGLLAALLGALAIATRGRPVVGLAMLVAAVGHHVARSPDVSNHGVWMFLLGVGALAVVAWSTVRRRTHGETLTGLLAVIGWVTVIAYSAAAFSKLNSSFLEPGISCASEFAGFWADAIGLSKQKLRSGTLGVVTVWGAALSELSIAMFIVVRRTRPLGIIVGTVFHFLMAFDNYRHFFDFTALVMFGLTALGGRELLGALGRRFDRGAARAACVLFGIGAAVLTLAFALTERTWASFTATYGTGALWPWRLVWWLGVGSVWATALLWHSVGVVRGRRGSPALHRGRGALVAGALSVLLAAGPYLGYRNALSFTMYSNLIAENGRTNHLLLPKVLTIGWPDESAIVLSATDEPLARYRTKSLPLPELAARLTDAGSSTVRYIAGSQIYAGPADKSPLVLDRQARLIRELRRFNALTLGTKQACAWQ
jgi:hypothetical protein